MKNEDLMDKIVSLAKRRGFIWQGSEVYGGMRGTWDYGPLGLALKRKIMNEWWDFFVENREDMFGVDAAIIMNPKVWQASGHAATFADPLVEDLKTGERYRADHLLKDAGIEAEGLSNEKITEIIREQGLKSPKGNELSEVRSFNMMFQTNVGAVVNENSTAYLRPETAQGIFTNYKNVVDSFYPSLPFGLAQQGKAFRNEISPRDFVFRSREFEQMEMQFFCQPGTEMTWFDYWKKHRLAWHEALGMGDDNYRFHDHEKLAHYANAATDIEFHMPFGFKEVEGIHSRTDFDLSQHEKFSGRSIKYFDPDKNENYTPYDVETSIGVDRMFLSVMCHSYTEEALENGSSRVVLKLPEPLAPVKCAVLPLVNKDGLPEKAQEIVNNLKFHFNTHMEAKDSIGKRYRRQDAIGTPFCVTVDGDTLKDNTVTLRYRDSMKQERVPVEKLREIIEDRVSITSLLKKIDID